MSCCGRARAQATGVAAVASPRAFGIRDAGAQAAAVTFEYVGRTGLSARGGVTGTTYRFDRPGARVRVDPRDAPSLSAVPVVRRVARA
jgi:hypothetical protein